MAKQWVHMTSNHLMSFHVTLPNDDIRLSNSSVEPFGQPWGRWECENKDLKLKLKNLKVLAKSEIYESV